MSSFEEECLNEHNKYRAIHGCPAVTLNKELCNFAKEWAEILARNNKSQHRPNLKYGENIYNSIGSKVDGKTAVENWYNEVKNYRYGGQDGFSPKCGHFTQVVWKKCQQIGVGYAQNGSSTYVVVNYDPPGNFSGDYLDNVPKPLN